MWKWIVGILVVITAGLGFGYFGADKDTRKLLTNLPTDRNVLFWKIPQRDAAFRTMDSIPVLAQSNVIEAGTRVFPLPQGEPISIPADVDAYNPAPQRLQNLAARSCPS